MTVYSMQPEEDLLLLEWYNTLMQSGDMEKAFTSPMQAVGTFITMMRPPVILMYEVDERGIWFAAWYDALMSSCTFGMWIRKDKRGKQNVPLLQESLRSIFGLVPVVIAVTRDPKVVQSAALFGFKSLGVIPKIWEGQDAEFIYLTVEDFKAANG